MKKLLFLIIALLAVLALSAQSPDIPDLEDPTLDKLLGAYNLLYGALVILWGYLAKLFGWKTEKVPFVFVVLAGGLVLALAFVVAGFSSVLPLLWSFLASLGIFDVIFKPAERLIKKT